MNPQPLPTTTGCSADHERRPAVLAEIIAAPAATTITTLASTDRTTWRSAGFLADIHRLRGIAILLIVAIHCSYLFNWRRHPTAELILNDFWDNSTMLFVFISGYLFQHLSQRYVYLHYLRTKLKNVLLPYALTALPAVLLALFHEDLIGKYPQLAHTSLLFRTLWLYANGGSLITFALWFIPVISIYYLASPAMIQFTRFPRLYAILLVLLPFSVFGHRPVYEYGHNIQLAIYFLPVYLLGMLFSQYRDRLTPLINSNLALLLCGYLAIFFGHLLLSHHHGKYTVEHMFDFQHGLIDWLFIQKLFFIVLLLGALNKYGQLQSPTLDYLARISFTIYFFHGYILYGFHWLLHFHSPGINAAGYALLYVGVIAACCLIAAAGTKLFGKWSRSIIGS